MTSRATIPVQPSILEPTGDSAKALQIVVVDFEANLNGITEKDVSFTEDRDIQGITVILDGHTAGLNKDSIYIAVGYDHPVDGWTEVQLMTRGESDGDFAPVPVSGYLGAVSEGTAILPVGVKIKIKYNSVAESGDKPYVYIVLRTWV